MKKTEQVLERLEAKGCCANLHKSFFMQKKVEYLGYLLTTSGLKPQLAKIEAMHHIMCPQNTKQLKIFLGMVGMIRANPTLKVYQTRRFWYKLYVRIYTLKNYCI